MELPALPRDYEGYPYADKLDAYQRALATVPVRDLEAHGLSSLHIEQAVVLATCVALRPDPQLQAQLNKILGQLPRVSGRHRRTVPVPLP